MRSVQGNHFVTARAERLLTNNNLRMDSPEASASELPQRYPGHDEARPSVSQISTMAIAGGVSGPGVNQCVNNAAHPCLTHSRS